MNRKMNIPFLLDGTECEGAFLYLVVELQGCPQEIQSLNSVRQTKLESQAFKFQWNLITINFWEEKFGYQNQLVHCHFYFFKFLFCYDLIRKFTSSSDLGGVGRGKAWRFSLWTL